MTHHAFMAILFACLLGTTACRKEDSDVMVDGEYFIPNGDVVLAGTLDLPVGQGPHPLLIFVPGSGTTTREDDRSVLDIALPHGIAVFRYDKRGLGQSTGMYQAVTVANSVEKIQERASDVAAIIQFFSGHNDIDPNRIILWGTSQGGWVAPLAATLTDHVALIICANGGGSSVGLQVYYSGLAADTGLTVDELTELAAGYSGIQGYDPSSTLSMITQPVLFVFGGLDRTNPVRSDTSNIRQWMINTGKDATVLVFPFTNHDLIDTRTGQLDDVLFDAVVAWGQEKLGSLTEDLFR